MKNKLATIFTGAMLILTTNSLPSYALNTRENSVTNTANHIVKNEELLITRKRWKRRRHRRRRRKIVCSIRRVYNRRQRKWVRVRICRRVSRRIFVRY